MGTGGAADAYDGDDLTDDDLTDDLGDEGEEGEDDDVQSYLLFSSENWRWPSWLPRLHLEIIQRRGYDHAPPSAGQLTTEEELANLREVFPQVTEGELRRVLLSSASLESAIEQLLDGLEM